jgi:seryl-tRNA synthetase
MEDWQRKHRMGMQLRGLCGKHIAVMGKQRKRRYWKMTTEEYDEMRRLGNDNSELLMKVKALKDNIDNLEEELVQMKEKGKFHIGRANMLERDVKNRDETIVGLEKKIAECEVYESFYNAVFYGGRAVSIIVGEPDNGKTQI